MKNIVDRFQKSAVRKNGRALLFYFVMFLLIIIIAMLSHSLYAALAGLLFLLLLAVRLIRTVNELRRIDRWLLALNRGEPELFRQEDTTFFLPDGWISWFNRRGVSGRYDEILTCSYAHVPLKSTEKFYGPFQLQISCQDNKYTMIQLDSEPAAFQIMAFLATQNPQIHFSEPLPRIRQELADLEEHPYH